MKKTLEIARALISIYVQRESERRRQSDRQTKRERDRDNWTILDSNSH